MTQNEIVCRNILFLLRKAGIEDVLPQELGVFLKAGVMLCRR